MISETDSIKRGYLSSPFICESIKNEIKTLLKYKQVVIQIGDINLTINIHYKDESESGINHFLQQIILMIRLLFSIHPINKKIIINYFLIDVKKELKKNYKIPYIMGKSEANSGSCLRGDELSEINIWRKEEIVKVTVHELIHALEFDNYQDTDKLINHYCKKYKISSQIINTNEAYTEIWANLINLYWISQKAERNNYEFFLTLLTIEKEFCRIQALKIMDLTMLQSKLIDINQESNILSYYIIRCELYTNLPQFLKLCRLHNENYVQINSVK